MTDIVERLRKGSVSTLADSLVLMHEAAGTIEHLRDMLEKLMAPGGAARIGPSFAEIKTTIVSGHIDPNTPHWSIQQDKRLEELSEKSIG